MTEAFLHLNLFIIVSGISAITLNQPVSIL